MIRTNNRTNEINYITSKNATICTIEPVVENIWASVREIVKSNYNYMRMPTGRMIP